MAARTRRTRFAASFVAVVAAGCSHDHPSGTGPGTASDIANPPAQPSETWSVHRENGTCWAMPEIHCPPPEVATCNPPALMQMPCPAGAPPDGFQVVSFDQGKTCVLRDSKTAVPCPSYDTPPPPPPASIDAGVPDAAQAAVELRAWTITQGDHTCYAERAGGMTCPAGATCNPPAPTKVSCPPFNPGNNVVEIAPDHCRMLLVMGGGHCPPRVHCNPPPPREVEVPCPQ
jgi:hypothetical protein